MTFTELVAFSGLLILVYMILIWLVSLAIKDASIIDFLWGPGFILVAWLAFFTTNGDPTRKLLLVGMVTIWGLRLALHIYLRNRGHGEDFRYKKWREESGSNWWWYSFFKVNFLQGVVMFIVAIPLLAAQYNPTPTAMTLPDWLGFVLWIIGFSFEAVGDWQLAQFKAKSTNKGKVMNTGLWRFTRHPNYFGDATLWWGYYLIAVAAGGWWTIFSPALMTLLLVRVSGVAMLEKNLKESKPKYKEYIRRTSAFFPMPPKP